MKNGRTDNRGSVPTGGASTDAAVGPTIEGSSGDGRILLAHAVTGGLACMVTLPLGIVSPLSFSLAVTHCSLSLQILARLLRTLWPRWIRAHWVIQGLLTTPLFIAAFVLGKAVRFDAYLSGGRPDADMWHSQTNSEGESSVGSAHSVIGVILLILIIAQTLFGSLVRRALSSRAPWPAIADPSSLAQIHWSSLPARMLPSFRRKPLGNWLHPLFGVLALVLAYVQVPLGLKYWNQVDEDRVPTGVWIAYGVLAGVRPASPPAICSGGSFSRPSPAGLRAGLRRRPRAPPQAILAGRGKAEAPRVGSGTWRHGHDPRLEGHGILRPGVTDDAGPSGLIAVQSSRFFISASFHCGSVCSGDLYMRSIQRYLPTPCY